jgi:hypothetical protein
MEYGWGGTMNQIQVKEILKKVFLSLESIKDEDLKKFMGATVELDTQDLVNIILDVSNNLEEEDIQRICKYIPAFHQDLIDTILMIHAGEKEEAARLLKIYKEVKQNIGIELKTQFLKDTTMDKTYFKAYLDSLSDSEINHAIMKLTEEESIVNSKCIHIIQEKLEKGKAKS